MLWKWPNLIEYLHVLLSRLFILFSFHVPCVTSLYFMLPSTFLRVLAWHGTHDAGHTCWNIFYVHCFRPLSGRNHKKKKQSQWIHITLLSSHCFLFCCLYFFGWRKSCWFSCENKINLISLSLSLCDAHYFFLFLLCAFHVLWTAWVSLLLPCPSGICSYLFIPRTFLALFRLLQLLVLSGFPVFFALCLLLSLLFPQLCCTCWRLMSNMKIGTTAGN